jgi:GNAT superfamily N-acetyltransferase
LNFGAFTGDGIQVAYALVATDHATFAWLRDVYVEPHDRSHGLGTRLAEPVVARLRPMGLKQVLLATRDAHEL